MSTEKKPLKNTPKEEPPLLLDDLLQTMIAVQNDLQSTHEDLLKAQNKGVVAAGGRVRMVISFAKKRLSAISREVLEIRSEKQEEKAEKKAEDKKKAPAKKKVASKKDEE